MSICSVGQTQLATPIIYLHIYTSNNNKGPGEERRFLYHHRQGFFSVRVSLWYSLPQYAEMVNYFNDFTRGLDTFLLRQKITNIVTYSRDASLNCGFILISILDLRRTFSPNIR